MQLFFRHFGSGDPVVIVHGLFGLSDNWVTFGRSISGSYSVFIPDLRNHGQSPHSNVFNFPSMENDLLEFMEEHDLRNINLIGHSLGGKVSMFFSIHHPELIKKLVIVDISLRRSTPGQEHQQLLNAMRAVDFSRVRSRSDVEAQLAGIIPSQRLRIFLLKNLYWRAPDRLDWRLNLEAIHEGLLSVFEGIDVQGTFTGPVLLIRGGLSDYVLPEDIPVFQTKFPGVVVKTIATASHWVHADAPGEFAGLVTAFLNSDQ
ncbi:MAG: alpha/beta fold hydrolase [Bacteroidales bacterium]|nr:alpha/beta fold hydrolase [Bacteroidales bacterium]HNW72664.1 alpha/beta fold hydrolase [Bacteroidales bacterium]HPS49971.1 alpha/beta fold hydrolase [Bacteroidales bacterium]